MGFSSSQLATASLVSQIGGGITSAVGSYANARNQAINLDLQAGLADTNARIAELGAQQELIRGQQEVASLTLQAGQLKSAQRTALAANGIDLGEGSAAEVQASADLMKEIDKNTAHANAVRSAWGYRTQGANYRSEAAMKRSAAGAISPGTAVAGTLLGGAGQVAESWYRFNKTGAFGGTQAPAPVVERSW